MAWDYQTNTGSFDLGELTNGADIESPLRDVSGGADDMQPSTPTGNGSGVFVDTQTQNAMFASLSQVLDYALKRDQQKMAGNQMTMQSGATQQQQQQLKKNRQFMWLMVLGGGAFLLASK